MKTTLCLDYRGDDPREYIEKMFSGILVRLSGFDRVCLFIRPPRGSDLKKRLEREVAWGKAVAEWRERVGRVPFDIDLFYDVWSTLGGPCDDWWKNIWRAFQVHASDRIVYFPVDALDVQATSSDSREALLQRFLNAAGESGVDLALGNYETFTESPTDSPADSTFFVPENLTGGQRRRDIRKNLLETASIAAMVACFPKTMADYFAFRTDASHGPHPRTGFFGMSRALFSDFAAKRGGMQPLAGTVHVLLHALVETRRKPNAFKIVEHFIGEIKQDAESFDHYSMPHQFLRDRFVVEDERAYWNWKDPKFDL